MTWEYGILMDNGFVRRFPTLEGLESFRAHMQELAEITDSDMSKININWVELPVVRRWVGPWKKMP